MKRLSGTDALFLSMESPSWHQHVGGVVILDPGESSKFSFERMRDTLDDRLDRVPKYRWKLKEVPLHLDRPVWVEDPSFDINRHVRRIAVPPPGGRRELGELIGQLMSHPLDRRSPLWELWYVDGVIGGQVAVIAKYHHCLMDGMSGASLAEQLFDLEPDPPEPPPFEGPVETPGDREPSDLELLARGLIPTVRTPGRMLRYAARSAQRGITMATFARRNPTPMLGAPATPFNGQVHSRRVLAFGSVALADVRKIKDEVGVKVNDVILALVAGALRRYLAGLDALPDKPLVAGVPVSTRVADDTEQTNQVATMAASLATDVEDPVERLKTIYANTQSAKAMTEAVLARKIQSVGEVAPPLLLNIASRAVWASNVARRMPVAQNVIVSNIPGPPIPLYSAGAKVKGIYAASVLMLNVGLNFTVMSYEDRVDFGITTDPDLVPDPWAIADCVRAALAELFEALKLGSPTEVHDPFDVGRAPELQPV